MLRGHVRADALWFPPGTRGLAERVLPLWEPGSKLVAGDFGHVLLMPRERPLDCARAPGAPLVQGSCTVEPAPPGHLRLTWHGQTSLPATSQLGSADPGLWLESEPVILEGEPLARPSATPEMWSAGPGLELRSELKVPARSQALQQVTMDLQEPSAPWWQRVLERILPSNQLSYLNRLTAMLERGDWDDALRHAIPLGSGMPAALARFVGRLRPRTDLTIGARPAPYRAALGMPTGGEGYLRMLYRRAFEHLDRAGEVDKAAFVLAELLQEHQRAVLYLEKHRRYRVAARLAEARELDPSLRIRLWFQADQVDLALQLATRHHAYQQAYLGLQGVDPERAEAWRWEWARNLAAAGRPAEALELVWNTGLEARREWLLPAVEQGGVRGGRSLARWLGEPRPEELPTLLELTREHVQNSDPLTQGRRMGLALGLMEGAPHPEARRVAGELTRVLLSQSDAGGWRPDRQQLDQLVRASGDPWLAADRPNLPSSPRARLDVWVERLEESGSLELLDAVTLPDGRLLAALGEAGLAVLSRRGRLAGILPVPTRRIIAPGNGELHLLLTRRGDLTSLVRLWPSSLKTRPWCEVQGLEWSALEHDGGAWLVVQNQTLFPIDLRAEGWRTLGKVPLRGPVSQGAYRPGSLGLNVGGAAEFYSLPDLQLRRRQEVAQPGFEVGPEEVVLPLITDQRVSMYGHSLAIELSRGPAGFVHGSHWTGLLLPQAGGTCLWLAHRQRLAGPAAFHFPGSERVSARFQGSHLVMADERGRLYVADLERGWFVRAHGVSL